MAEVTHHRTGRNRYGEEVGEVRSHRIVVLMTSAEVAALDEYQFSNRIETRAKAIRQLLAERSKP